MSGWVVDVLEALGYAGLALVLVAETLFPPIPSEAILPLAGFLVGQGRFVFLGALAASTLGSVVGALLLYAVGLHGGRPLVLRHGRWLRVGPAELDRAEGWFARYGDAVVLWARMVPLARSVVSIPAGTARMPLLRFTVLTTMGSAAWNALLIGAGWALGANWERVGEIAGAYSDAAVALLAASAVALAVYLSIPVGAATDQPAVPPATGRMAEKSTGGCLQAGTRVLIVEDDRPIAELVQMELEHRGASARCAFDGPSGLAAAEEFEPSVIVLDIMLPGMDGVGVLRALRRRGDRTPVIMLTARDAPADKIHGLQAGADDYVSKPFDTGELVARVDALLRRSEGEEVLRVADLEVNTATRAVRRGGREVEDLTAREYDLLEFMARNPRRVLSRDLLLSRVWGEEFGFETKVVDVYVGYLRRKLEAPGEGRLIRTVRGVGYALRGR